MDRIAPPPRSRGGKAKFWAGGTLIVAAILLLIVNGLRTGGNYYLTVDELAERGESMVNRGVRVNGQVDTATVNYDSRAISLAFEIVDPESGARRQVLYQDPMPDLFLKSESVIVEGRVTEAGVLEAHTILVKCPSKYEEAQQKGEEIPVDHFGGDSS